MTRTKPRPANADAAALTATPPRLAIDACVGALAVAVFGLVVSASLTPDGVAYLENAELLATGQAWRALQGYWSPGYSLLLVPAVWLANGDRSALLALAHCVQIGLALAAIRLTLIAVRRRVPPVAQRAVFWICLWIVLRWLSQELLTPDLLLATLVLAFLAHQPATSTREAVMLGAIIGLAFLAKTSIWPSLLIAGTAVVVQHWRATGWPRTVTITVGVGVVIAAAFVIPLSVKSGRVTLGGVGALNAGWYLGDLDRRTPDTDQRFHEARRLALLPSGTSIAVYEMPPGTSTYAPWALPEEWATGFRPSERQTWNAAQAQLVWRQNVTVALRSLLPLLAGVLALRLLARGPRDGAVGPLLDWPIAAVGGAGALAFMVVHAELRLLAPSALLLTFAAWPDQRSVPLGAARRALVAALTGALALHLAVDLSIAGQRARTNAVEERALRAHLAENVTRLSQRNVVLVGPFGPWVAMLWEYRLRVHAQIGAEAGALLEKLPPDQRLWWIRDQFGRSIAGVADATTRVEGAYLRTERRLTLF